MQARNSKDSSPAAALPAPQPASSPAKPGAAPADGSAQHEVAIVGGGCFWCIEACYNQLAGVHSALSGYAGGHVQNPSYEEVRAVRVNDRGARARAACSRPAAPHTRGTVRG